MKAPDEGLSPKVARCQDAVRSPVRVRDEVRQSGDYPVRRGVR